MRLVRVAWSMTLTMLSWVRYVFCLGPCSLLVRNQHVDRLSRSCCVHLSLSCDLLSSATQHSFSVSRNSRDSTVLKWKVWAPCWPPGMTSLYLQRWSGALLAPKHGFTVSAGIFWAPCWPPRALYVKDGDDLAMVLHLLQVVNVNIDDDSAKHNDFAPSTGSQERAGSGV